MSDSIIRKIAVIFVTDVVGFSKMMEVNEDKTLQSFRACMDMMETLFSEHGGGCSIQPGIPYWPNSRVLYRLLSARQNSKSSWNSATAQSMQSHE